MEEITPTKAGQSEGWEQRLLSVLGQVIPIKALVTSVIDFVKRVSLLPQVQEREQIQNMRDYLTAVDEAAEQMRRNGVDEATIKQFVTELSVPLVKQNMQAMLLRRAVEPPAPPKSA